MLSGEGGASSRHQARSPTWQHSACEILNSRDTPASKKNAASFLLTILSCTAHSATSTTPRFRWVRWVQHCQWQCRRTAPKSSKGVHSRISQMRLPTNAIRRFPRSRHSYQQTPKSISPPTPKSISSVCSVKRQQQLQNLEGSWPPGSQFCNPGGRPG